MLNVGTADGCFSCHGRKQGEIQLHCITIGLTHACRAADPARSKTRQQYRLRPARIRGCLRLQSASWCQVVVCKRRRVAPRAHLLAQASRGGCGRGIGAGVVLGPSVAPAAPLPRIYYALEAADEYPRVVPKGTSHGPARQGRAWCHTERARCVENAPIGSDVSPSSCSCVYRDTSAVASQGADLQSARNLLYWTS